jgi:hypothetical protein
MTNATQTPAETRTALEITLPVGRRGENATSTSAVVTGLTRDQAYNRAADLAAALRAAGFTAGNVRALDLNNLTGKGLYMKPAILAQFPLEDSHYAK